MATTESELKENTAALATKFHEIQILLIFGLRLQIMIHLIILATKARDVNTMDMAAAKAVAPCGVDTISMSGFGGQSTCNQMHHDLESKAKY